MIELLKQLLHLDHHLAWLMSEYGTLTYLLLFLIIFAETGLVVTPFLPGDSLLFAIGTFAADSSSGLNVWVVITVLTAAAFLGNIVNYRIGYYVGPAFLEKEKIPFIKKEYITRTQEFYQKYGIMAIIIGRFTPIIRTFVPFVAGIGKMDWKNYVLYTFVGAISWIASITLLGYFLGNLPIVKENKTLILLGIVILSVIPSILVVLKEWFGNKNNSNNQK